MNHIDGGLGDHLAGQIIGIALAVDHGGYSGVDDHFCADDTGHRGAVQGGAVNVGAVLGGLDDGVLLGVQAAAELVALPGRDIEPLAQAAGRITVGNAGRNPVVSGGQDVAILDQHSTNLSAQTGGAGGHQVGDIHEILIPGGSLHV